MLQVRFILPLVLLALTSACKDQVELRTGLFTDMCTQIFSCGCKEYPYADIAQCEQVNAVDYAGIEASAEAAGLTVDTICLLNSAPVSKYQCKTGSEVYEDEGPTGCERCAPAYGDVAVGEACLEYDYFDNCAPGLACRGGACVDPCAPLVLGDECSPGADECGKGLFCTFETYTCVKLPGAGQPCTDTCEEGFYCDFDTSVCLKYPGLGQPCPNFECAGDLACSYEEGAADYTCQPLPGKGQSCDFGLCAGDLYCLTDPDTFEGVCVSLGAKGQSCSLAPCSGELVCGPSDTCQDPPGPGEPCGGTSCSETAYCDYEIEICKALPGVGESCYDGYGCALGLLCGEGDVCEQEQPLICEL